ncbi:MAG: type II toxin-antitoxin system RelE/ParE family toxin [Endomicrobium sp.]|jgi:phage-related protein|nr:type II toxin-antitoxin system RelE/ParE family toxin [Endomicrobium sp.]
MKIVFYQTENGRIPVKKDIDNLEKVDKAEVFGILENIERNGFNSNRVEFRQIKGKLWEIKMRLSTTGYRIFYTSIDRDTIILLHSYKKKTQKAPSNDLNVAFKRMNDVLE